jgi:thymidylate kinase
LSGWPKLLKKELRTRSEVTVLDQGPVYLLTELRLFGPEFLRGDSSRPVWQAYSRQWAAMLDGIVWLDAPDECLIQRIRHREKDHIVKDKPKPAIVEFLRCYRQLYDRILAEFAGQSRALKILRFDTSRQPVEAIANQVLRESSSVG